MFISMKGLKMSQEDSPSIVEYFGGDDEGHKCGYCKGLKSNKSHGMWAHTMNVQDYENLIDRGWRRSGQYCYKPMMNVTCCPMYTIRCDAVNFQLNRSHKKVLKKVHNFLLKGVGNRNQVSMEKETTSEVSDSVREEIPSMLRNKVKKSEMVVENAAVGTENWRVPQKKAKLIRIEKKMQKTGGILEKSSQTPSKSLEEFLKVESITAAHHLEIKLVNTSSPEFQVSMAESWKLYVKYQVTVHNDEEAECNMEQFKRFLCKSPLQKHTPKDGLYTGYGSFHQQYYLDGKLISVGVIDILPTCLSSVYFFYDPDYSFLSLGTYASLREMAFVRHLNQSCPDFAWYYLGYYIHTCPKMAYKGQYKPSYLLCPETYTWQPISRCIPKLDRDKYARLENDHETVKEDKNSVDISEVGILHKRRAMTYTVYSMVGRPSKPDEDAEEVKEYAVLVGPESAVRILLYRS
nr:EOG090X06AF [Eurycercus lamellatus]